jgi:hypothetical protein
MRADRKHIFEVPAIVRIAAKRSVIGSKEVHHMLKHMVMFKKKADTSNEVIDEIMSRLEALHGQIPGLLHLKCHRSLPSDRPVVWTFLLDSTLDAIESLPVYIEHPAHIAVNEWMTPFLESRAVVDFEL